MRSTTPSAQSQRRRLGCAATLLVCFFVGACAATGTPASPTFHVNNGAPSALDAMFRSEDEAFIRERREWKGRRDAWVAETNQLLAAQNAPGRPQLLLQTDRPLYGPGDSVLVRLLVLHRRADSGTAPLFTPWNATARSAAVPTDPLSEPPLVRLALRSPRGDVVASLAAAVAPPTESRALAAGANASDAAGVVTTSWLYHGNLSLAGACGKAAPCPGGDYGVAASFKVCPLGEFAASAAVEVREYEVPAWRVRTSAAAAAAGGDAADRAATVQVAVSDAEGAPPASDGPAATAVTVSAQACMSGTLRAAQRLQLGRDGRATARFSPTLDPSVGAHDGADGDGAAAARAWCSSSSPDQAKVTVTDAASGAVTTAMCRLPTAPLSPAQEKARREREAVAAAATARSNDTLPPADNAASPADAASNGTRPPPTDPYDRLIGAGRVALQTVAGSSGWGWDGTPWLLYPGSSSPAMAVRTARADDTTQPVHAHVVFYLRFLSHLGRANSLQIVKPASIFRIGTAATGHGGVGVPVLGVEELHAAAAAYAAFQANVSGLREGGWQELSESFSVVAAVVPTAADAAAMPAAWERDVLKLGDYSPDLAEENGEADAEDDDPVDPTLTPTLGAFRAMNRRAPVLWNAPRRRSGVSERAHVLAVAPFDPVAAAAAGRREALPLPPRSTTVLAANATAISVWLPASTPSGSTLLVAASADSLCAARTDGAGGAVTVEDRMRVAGQPFLHVVVPLPPHPSAAMRLVARAPGTGRAASIALFRRPRQGLRVSVRTNASAAGPGTSDGPATSVVAPAEAVRVLVAVTDAETGAAVAGAVVLGSVVDTAVLRDLVDPRRLPPRACAALHLGALDSALWSGPSDGDGSRTAPLEGTDALGLALGCSSAGPGRRGEPRRARGVAQLALHGPVRRARIRLRSATVRLERLCARPRELQRSPLHVSRA